MKEGGGQITRVEKPLAVFGGWLIVHHRAVLLLAALATLLSLLPARTLRISRAEEILFPSNQSAKLEGESLVRRIGGSGVLIGVVEGGRLEDRKRFVDDWARRVKEDHDLRVSKGKPPLLNYVIHRFPIRFFEDRRLLYLKVPDLLDIEDRVNRRLDQEKKKKNPFYVDLEDEVEPEVDVSFKDLEEKYGVKRFHEYSTTEDRAIFTILFKPTQPSYNTAFSAHFTEWIEKEGRELIRNGGYPGVGFSLGGTYVEQVMNYRLLGRESARSAVIALVGFALLAGIVFRRFRPVFLIGLSGLVGFLWLQAAAALVFKEIGLVSAFALPNVLTLFLANGFTLLHRYEIERLRNLPFEDAMVEAIAKSGRISVLTSLLLLLSGLLFMLFDVDDLNVFGLLTAMGAVLYLVVLLAVLPSVAILFERAYLVPVSPAVIIAQPMPRRIPREKALIAIGSALSLIGLFLVGEIWCLRNHPPCVAQAEDEIESCSRPKFDFEFDFHNLGRKIRQAEEVRRKFHKAVPLSLEPLVVLAPDRKKLDRFLNDLDESNRKSGRTIGSSSIVNFVPADQTEKLRIMKRIDDLATEENIGFFESRIRREIDDVRPLLHPPIISIYQLPRPILLAYSQQPIGSERLMDILSMALTQLPAKLSPGEWNQAVTLTLDRISEAEITSILERLSDTEFFVYKKGDASRWSLERKRKELLNILREFHERNVGTVAYLDPLEDPLPGGVALELEERIGALRAKHPEIRVVGQALELARMIRNLPNTAPLSAVLTILFTLALCVVFIRRPLHGLLAGLGVLFADLWLVDLQALLGMKWNAYSIMTVPLISTLAFDSTLRFYMQYREDGQVGALRSMLTSGPPIIFYCSTVFFAVVGMMLSGHGGIVSFGRTAGLGILTAFLVALAFLPPLLEYLHAKTRKVN